MSGVSPARTRANKKVSRTFLIPQMRAAFHCIQRSRSAASAFRRNRALSGRKSVSAAAVHQTFQGGRPRYGIEADRENAVETVLASRLAGKLQCKAQQGVGHAMVRMPRQHPATQDAGCLFRLLVLQHCYGMRNVPGRDAPEQVRQGAVTIRGLLHGASGEEAITA